MKQADKVVPLRPPKSGRKREEITFLPAALEIVETPASPAGRAIAATIIAVFCLALAWAAFGRIDIVASARGKIIPSGRSKVIQPLETGVVRAIHVQDGQQVKAGDLLIQLDPTMTDADVNHLKSDLISAQLDVARLRAALADPDAPLDAFNPPRGAPSDLVATHRRLLLDQIAEQRAKLGEIDRERAQKEAGRGTISANIGKIKATIPILQQLVDIRKALLEQKITSKLQYLDASLKLVDRQRDIEVQLSKYQEADAAIAALVETRAKTVANFHRSLLSELADAERKAADAAQDVIKAEQRTKLQSLKAPISGIVQQLAVHTVGGVVTPAQPLLVLVPIDDKLCIRAMVQNRDIGFVHAGQKAKIKVDAFNFTRYGLLHGKVLSVSRDAIVQNKPSRGPNGNIVGAETSSSVPQGQELVYSALISLDRSTMQVGSKLVNLSPGEAATVEIDTGSRTIISYLLSPLARLSSKSLHGR